MMERRDDVDSSERREGAPRDTCRIEARLAVDGNETIPCVITDISLTGAKVTLDASCVLPTTFALVIPIDQGLDETRRCELRWRVGDRTGIRFLA